MPRRPFVFTLLVFSLAALMFGLCRRANADDLQADDADSPRGFHEIRRDLDELFRRESAAKTPEQREAAVRGMSSLYLEIVRDPRLETSPTLQQNKARLWRRLLNVKQDVEQKIAQRQRLEERKYSRDELERRRAAEEAAAAESQSLADSMSLVVGSVGGPARVFAGSGGAFGGGPRDDGETLVRLIEHTISPEFWDVNGGPGSIFYYAPLQALVVRASDDVHGSVGGLVGGLRAAP